MTKDRICQLLRDYARQSLSPKLPERQFVSTIYESVQVILGENNCLQIGSFPRFTAVTPLHDLDVLFVLGEWVAEADPTTVLEELEKTLKSDFDNPTKHAISISKQSHSVTVSFSEGDDEIFAVDIVPAYVAGSNEFAQDTYMVPELANKPHRVRAAYIQEVRDSGQSMGWIITDPRGYIQVSHDTNARCSDFRKAVKIVKDWKNAWKSKDDSFPLKSFHLEQVITLLSLNNPEFDIFDLIFRFFVDLPEYLRNPQIPDRADATRFIDEYVRDINALQREKIQEARDFVLIQLEEIAEDSVISFIFSPGQRRRASAAERYLFDSRIPVFSEHDFSIKAVAREQKGGFRARLLDAVGLIDIGRNIDFSEGNDAPPADMFKWKVKNDDASPQPRGEITDHKTMRSPEHTQYRGSHYVECFAIKDGVCIGRSKQNVVLSR